MVLEDLTVLDCSQAGAGPYGAGILAKAGADVINVEPPGGATTREYVGGGWFACSDQRKRSIGVDLTTEASRELMADLVADADVVFHNYMPETAEKLGLDYETLRSYNDAIIVTVVSGFGKDGPYRDRIAYDPIAQAMSGLMHVTGEPDRKPARVGGSTVDIGTGINAALGTLMALHRREITGEGRPDRRDAVRHCRGVSRGILQRLQPLRERTRTARPHHARPGPLRAPQDEDGSGVHRHRPGPPVGAFLPAVRPRGVDRRRSVRD